MQKYQINKNFFDKIDSMEKAYFLGLIFSDGHHQEERNMIRIYLQETDKEILIKLNNLIQPEKPLYISDRKEKEPTFQTQFGLVIQNKHISKKMLEYYCLQNKTESLKFPNFLKDDLIWHFIRGFFDGDGHIGTLSNSSRIVICGTLDFCSDLKKILNNNLIKCSVYKQKNIWKLGISSKHDIYKFCDLIYKNKGELFLERKYKRYLEFFNEYKKWIFTNEKRNPRKY